MQKEPYKIVRSRSSDQVSRFVRTLAQQCHSLDFMAWFVHGMGGQPKSFYQDLPHAEDYEVVAIASVMPKWTTIIAPFLAGWAGVVRIRDCARLAPMFELVGEQTMAAIYAFDATRIEALTQVAKEQLSELEHAVESDPQHFIYVVDEDSATETGDVVEIIKWGPRCPSILAGLVDADST